MVKFDPVSSSREVMSTSNVHEIQKTKATPKTKNVPMVDGKKRRSNAEIKAQAKLKEDIKNDNVFYNETGIFGAIGTLIDKGRIDNEIRFFNFPKDTTLGDIKKRYNLPPGSLRHLVTTGGGDFDSYKVSELDGPVYIFADDMQKGLGVSADELKEMFPDKQFSPWNENVLKELVKSCIKRSSQ